MISKMPTLKSLFLKRGTLRMADVKLTRMNRNIFVSGAILSMRLPHANNVNVSRDGQGNTGFIKGRTLEKDLPVSRRVMCYHRRTGNLIAKTWSDNDGYFEFNNLEPNVSLYITSIDNDGNVVNHAAVTQDLLTAHELI